MIPALFLTLGVVASPAHSPANPRPWSHEGCPAAAIAFYRFTPNVRSSMFGLVTQDLISFGSIRRNVRGGEYPRDGRQIFHFWRTDPRPRVAVRAEVDPDTHEVRALDGSVRKVGAAWCMFSVPEPIPARLFVEDNS